MVDKALLHIPRVRAIFGFCAVIALLRAVATIGQAIGLASAIVRIWEGESLLAQGPWIALFILCYLMREVLLQGEQKKVEAFAFSTITALRRDALGAVYDHPAESITAFGAAGITMALSDGALEAEEYLSLVIPKTVSLIVGPLVIAIAIGCLDAMSGLIVAVCYPFIIIFMRLIGHSASDEAARRLEGFSRMSSHFMDALRGLRTLKAFGVSRSYAQTIFSASESYRRQIMKTLRIATLSGTVLDLFSTGGLAAVAIMLGFRMVEGELGFFPGLAVLMLVPEFFMPIKAYASDYHATLSGKSSLDELTDISRVQGRSLDMSAVAVEVASGARIGIVGPSGSGKTTLLDGIAGIIDGTGLDVKVDGHPLSDDAALGHRIAYISQEPGILSATLGDNVRLYHRDASDEEVCAALERVGLKDLLEELGEGLDTKIGDGGRGLSGGQAHRVALARALVDPARDIWLLDEPGSDLDVQTEMELVESIEDLMEGKTVFIATHRPHWIRQADLCIDMGQLSTGSGYEG